MTVHDLFILLGTPCDVENNVYSAAVGEMFYECPLALECSFSVMIVDFPLRVICPLVEWDIEAHYYYCAVVHLCF
jgi:hypothetical protein